MNRSADSYMQASVELRSRLMNGEWAPGERLPSERNLAEELKISRPTLRQVLSDLEQVGMVQIRAKVGVFSHPLSHVENGDGDAHDTRRARISECIEAREVIETASLRLVVSRITEEDLVRLDSIMDSSRQARNDARAIEYDRQFHLELHGVLGNPIIHRYISNCFDLLWQWYPTVLGLPGRRERSWQQHQAILAAVRAGEPDTAAGAMLEHLAVLRHGLVDERGAANVETGANDV